MRPEDDFFAVVFLLEDFFADVFFAEDFFAGDFFAGAFLLAVFLVDAFFVEEPFFAEDFFAAFFAVAMWVTTSRNVGSKFATASLHAFSDASSSLLLRSEDEREHNACGEKRHAGFGRDVEHGAMRAPQFASLPRGIRNVQVIREAGDGDVVEVRCW